jgi:hypothetical protein
VTPEEEDLALKDDVLHQALTLFRYTASATAAAVNRLKAMESKLIKTLSRPLDRVTKAITKEVIAEADAAIADTYTLIQNEISFADVGEIVAKSTGQSLQIVLGSEAKGLTDAYFKSLQSNVLIEGSPAADWWAAQSDDVKFKFAGQVRQGLANAETNQQIIARIVGKNGAPGIMDVARRDAAALVQTSVQAVANDARLSVFQNNADILQGVRQLSTLDSHTCFTAGHMVLMADGSSKAIEKIVAGDFVIGGLTKKPRKVVATQSVVKKTVSVFVDNGQEFQCTPEHRFLTAQGWVAASDLLGCGLSAYFSKRKNLYWGNCEFRTSLARTLSRKFSYQRSVKQSRAQGCVTRNSQIRRGECAEENSFDTRNAGRCYDSGNISNNSVQFDKPKRLQYDARWRGCDRSRAGSFETHVGNGKGEIPKSRICSKNENQNERFWTEGRYNSQSVLRILEGTNLVSCQKQIGLVKKYYNCEATTEDCGTNCDNGCCRKKSLARSSTQGKSKRGARSRSSIVASKSRMGCSQESQNGFSHEGQMARPGVFSENGKAPTVIRIEERGIETVYDIQVENPDNSFICNNIVVHNSLICIAYSNAEWDLEGNPINGTTLPFNGGPPRHFNCRSLLVGISKNATLRNRQGNRASDEGPIDRKISFDDFLKRKSNAYVDEMLGKGRADLWRSGSITLKDLVNGQGRPLTLKELQAKFE